MTNFFLLPEHVDTSTVDTADLVRRIEAGEVVLDWAKVSTLDHETGRKLLVPFEGRYGEYGDALGIWKMPDEIESDVNWITGEGPKPVGAWVFLHSEESKYDDESGRHYEYTTSIPNGKQVAVGDQVVCMLVSRVASNDQRIFGVGKIVDIRPAPTEGRVQAIYEDYQQIDPPLTLEEIGGDPRGNPTNAINRISALVVTRVRVAADGPRGAGNVPSSPEVERPGEGISIPEPCPLPDLSQPTPASVRDALHQLVSLDLLGPACGPEEELLQSPKNRYLVGRLAPKDDAIAPLADDDELDGAGEESGGGEGTAGRSRRVSNSLFSSSIGFTFAVSGDVEAIRVRVSWGSYDRVRSAVHFTDAGNPKMVWRRSARGGNPFDLTLEPRRLEKLSPDPESRDVRIEGIIRPIDSDGSKLITLFLSNEQVVSRDERLKDRKWIFQPEIEVAATDEESAVFVRRDGVEAFDPEDSDLEEEERALLGMVYRKQVEFAIGHGVAVAAEPAGDPWVDEEGWERATRIRTKVLPWHDVPSTRNPTNDELLDEFPGFPGFELDMGQLATLPQEELISALSELPTMYGRWIDNLRTQLEQGQKPDLDHHLPAVDIVLERAEKVRLRLEEGVELLKSDDLVLKAFRFTNKAMRLQRLRSVFALRRRRGEDVEFEKIEAEEATEWRTFQLAFLLLNIPTIAQLDHARRNNEMAAYADLLWFPTGGGKTEAYLGVAAFAVAVRRLQGDLGGYQSDGGVSVIMRYTLRLLTLQQFQRTSTLVCAMESLRLSDNDPVEGTPWGNEPFRIGLWVGNNATPATTNSAGAWVNQNRQTTTWQAGVGNSSPLQLTNCPWCGHKLSPDHVKVDRSEARTKVLCREVDCDFNARNSANEGIPVLTVDEEIYRLLPTFLLATVDKFAQMPMRSDIQTLFGRVTGRCERHGWLSAERFCEGNHHPRGSLPRSEYHAPPRQGLRPPDLIIQDELHLISGPLGTLVGLYETAIDRLCTWENDGEVVRAKVIASTATIRRAPEQVHRLFCRQVEVFPPVGLEATDNFFSRQAKPTVDEPGRRYLGVCAPGASRVAVLIRTYVALLTASEWLWNNIDESHQDLVDPYKTILGYFNSLRELGGMNRRVEDDVATRAFRVERPDRPGLAQRKIYPESTVQELTSRIPSSRIPEILDRLEAQFTDSDDGHENPLDVVLATNMVSVGVDVQRLGLMVVSGQPKTTAEYIQATSRVGRSIERPGLVVTALNWARPRDLSHYEHFVHSHSVFHRYVEALSVTPFAPRALDRGLTGVLAALVRLSETGYSHNHGAGLVTGAGQFPEVIQTIKDRAMNTARTEQERSELELAVEQAMSGTLDEWAAKAEVPDRRLGYTKPRRPDDVTVPLLTRAGTKSWSLFTVPNSMREVEPQVGLVVREGEMNEDIPDWQFDTPGDTEGLGE